MRYTYHSLLVSMLLLPTLQHAQAERIQPFEPNAANPFLAPASSSNASQSIGRIESSLPTIVINAQKETNNADGFNSSTIKHEQLIDGSSTLGDALSGELSIHADSFGGGASRPVIRGHGSPRITVRSDGAQVMDASNVSPDHAVTVEPLLAEKIEIQRGASALLYSSGAIGGVVNVLDTKIPSRMPENGIEGDINLRANTVADEKAVATAITLGLGEQFAVHVEGIKRDANDYKVRGYLIDGQNENRVDGSYAKGETASIGLSWIGARGFAGLAFTQKKDEYGLPGHSHEYEGCHTHETHLHCGEHGHDHEHEHGDHEHDEQQYSNVPRIALQSKRLDLKAEYDQPFYGVQKLKFRAGFTDYQHQEIEENTVATQFNNKGYDARVELTHNPFAGINGSMGLHYSRSDFAVSGEEAFLPKTLTETISAFLVEQYQWQDVHVKLGARQEWQTIRPELSEQKFSTQKYDAHASSVALDTTWQFMTDYALGVSLSHNQRLPTTQELYANGAHFASNTYELGNADLNKEKSNTISLTLSKTAGDVRFNVTGYHHHIDDYIYAKTLDKFKDFRLIQYTQRDAKFDGVEAQTSYQLDDVYKLSLFGDYVRAKLNGNPAQENHNLPRIPAARLGSRAQTNWDGLGGIIGGSLEYSHVFKQTDTATDETKTSGYHLINAQLSYEATLNTRQDYRLYVQMNNLLDEKYYSHSSFLSFVPQAGRNFTAGLQLKF